MAGSRFTGPLYIKKSDGSKVQFVDADGNLTAATSIAFGDGDYLADDNGNELILFSVSASAVNEITVANAVTGDSPIIQASGGDANVDLVLEPKGTGVVELYSDEAGAVGAVLRGWHESASPAASDVALRILAQGEDSASNTQEYGRIDFVVTDPTSTSEAGAVEFYAANASGSSTLCGQLTHDGSNGILSIGDGSANGKVQGAGANDLELVTSSGSDSSIQILPDGTGAIVLGGSVFHTDITSSSGAGAVPLTGRIHEITTTGTGDALTLANAAAAGQRLTLIYVAEGAGADTAVLTPTTLAGGTTITFNNLGDSAELVYSSTGGWYVVGLGGAAAVA